MIKICTALFNSNGTWTAPAGVTAIFVVGCGGGGGGAGGNGLNTSTTKFGIGWGGQAAVPGMIPVTVVPNTTYTITIGAGGTAGTGSAIVVTNIATVWGSPGGNTTFDVLVTFYGALGGRPGFTGSAISAGNYSSSCIPGQGGEPLSPPGSGVGSSGITFNAAGHAAGGTGTGTGSAGSSGGGGGAGVANVGGTGGVGAPVASGNGGNGVNAAANSGAGGGGGGDSSKATGGNGGNGGSGFLEVIWFE
jgi:hypothetical protein